MTSGLRGVLALSFLLLAQLPLCPAGAAPPATSNGPQILEEFGRQQPQRPARATTIAEHERQVIMFTIGITKGRWNTMLTALQQFKVPRPSVSRWRRSASRCSCCT